MPAKIDLTNQKFAQLTVLAPAPKVGKRTAWTCRCDCGNECVVKTDHLCQGYTKSCGCRISKKGQPGDAGKSYWFSQYKSSASRRGLCFEIPFADFIRLTQRNCVYCGREPSIRATGSTGKSAESKAHGLYIANGLDRKDNALGYTLDNAVPCCSRCNLAKRDMSHTEFIEWIRCTYKHLYGGTK